MIEIEKKFKLTKKQESDLLNGAIFIDERKIHDKYYDCGFKLSIEDRWLRNRNGKWELKVSQQEIGKKENGVDRYLELDDDSKIIKELGLSINTLTENSLKDIGYVQISDFVTTRASYEKEEFTIVLDKTDFGVAICEIEIVISDSEDAEAASNKIVKFAKRHNLNTGSTLGKVLLYFIEHDKQRYNAMQEAGVTPF